MPAPTPRRLPAARRRELVITAAQEAFANHGYEGTSTDTVARLAGVSQGYIVRLFGTKKALFQHVVAASLDHVRAALRPTPDSGPTANPASARTRQVLGRAYLRAIAEKPATLLVLLRLISSGTDPDLARLARETLSSLHRSLRDDAGLGPGDAARFLANGLLTSALAATATRPEDDDPDLRELLEHTVEDNVDAYSRLLARTPSTTTAARRGPTRPPAPR
ncbi:MULTISPECIES: TetR/AcrR family transcriptional regulator [Actinoalloteichus]|uniref:TetR/AcrR family transcriptional regulator n=1 Tax=Actinoalloteichus TaxID=65496 RepID=UPI00068B8506|nr:TetR/AcrR family transcriptional regulator [Actinoalloteichus caeruleus]